jgi:predicted anti-sigma-YlaC factor YlaD
VRDAVSARLDAEATGLRRGALSRHLARCTGCRDYQSGLTDLELGRDGAAGGVTIVQSSRPVPDALRLALHLDEMPQASSARPRVARRLRPDSARAPWRRRLQWAVAVVPAVVLATVLPLGAWASPKETPSHAATPCTGLLKVIGTPAALGGATGASGATGARASTP